MEKNIIVEEHVRKVIGFTGRLSLPLFSTFSFSQKNSSLNAVRDDRFLIYTDKMICLSIFALNELFKRNILLWNRC